MTRADDRSAPATAEDPPPETEGVGEDPGSLPGDELAVDPVGADDPEPDVNDDEAPQPLGDSTSDPDDAGQDEASHPEHYSAMPAFDDDQDDPDALPRG